MQSNVEWMSDEFKAQKRLATSYHEAGHAAVLWLTGTPFEHVRMEIHDNGECGTWGAVNARMFDTHPEFRVTPFLAEYPLMARAASNRLCINSLAGYASESHQRGQLDGWYDAEVIEGWEWEEDDRHDITKALEAIRALGLTDGHV